MLRLNRTSVTARIAVVAVIAGLSYLLIGAAVRPASAQPNAPAARVEFTADGKLKQPVGYRKWVYIGTPVTPNDMNDGEASFPEFHEVYMDPESFAHYEKTGKFRDGTLPAPPARGAFRPADRGARHLDAFPAADPGAGHFRGHPGRKAGHCPLRRPAQRIPRPGRAC